MNHFPIAPIVLDNLAELAFQLREARRRRRQTLEEFAGSIGVSRRTLQRMEQGEPGVSMGAFMAAMIHISPSAASNLANLINREADPIGASLENRKFPNRFRNRTHISAKDPSAKMPNRWKR